MGDSPTLYHYKGVPLNVVDGDTIDVEVDLGFRTYAKIRFRLYGVDAPERYTAKGPAATEFVETWLQASVAEDKDAGGSGIIYLKTFKPFVDKYGRWLTEVYSVTGRSLTEDLISSGNAILWRGPGS